MQSVIGWDIGGAHVKAARIAEGRVVDVIQLPCPLWLGVDRLAAALREASARLGPAELHAATMTGELADAFPDRATGVAGIAAALTAAFAPARLALYGGRAGFLAADQAAAHAADIASANWHASAALAGGRLPDALLVDIGSTTTDIVPVAGGCPAPAGYSDPERLSCGELVYTGLVRSFLMAIASHAPVGGRWTPLVCEHFATTADVYRLLGELAPEVDQMPTADGRGKSLRASRARLARMVGRDAADATEAEWRDVARWFAEQQLRRIEDAVMLVLSRARLPDAAPVLGAGIGRHLAARLAARLQRPYRDFTDSCLDGAPSVWAGHCAPAIAVALLAGREASAQTGVS
ncbi:MAG TPA: hydantoinase/oxoprolinase family protein [Acetobacteraceae bacterium]|nr:hydantoinase/oxoprolinase family protein [Acetobacteraceae bacterium]